MSDCNDWLSSDLSKAESIARSCRGWLKSWTTNRSILFTLAVCRTVVNLKNETVEAIDVAEKVLAGEASANELLEPFYELNKVRDSHVFDIDDLAFVGIVAILRLHKLTCNETLEAIWLNEINYKEPPTSWYRRVERFCGLTGYLSGSPSVVLRDFFWGPNEPVFNTAWRTPDVVQLADAAYLRRNSTGVINKQSLAILADALEEAGCCDVGLPASLLTHLKSRDPHFQGCWVLELIRNPKWTKRLGIRQTTSAG